MATKKMKSSLKTEARSSKRADDRDAPSVKNPPGTMEKARSDRTSAPPGETGDFLTTNQGLRLSDNHNSLKAGPRGPTLLEDFVLREKITHFDHERIPERVVHARGAGAFGYFECTREMSEFTAAGLFSKKGKRTPVLTRFSTVAGSRGSADTARDVRGFAVKFYTDEGNWDFVGNNIPVFFIQDAMKFPDLIHAVKPEPHNEIPQAASAHDTFWDFISLMPESMHMIFWVMSDRSIPRSLRMMEGFGVHTFKFVTSDGESSFVKFHWKPKLGVHSVTWEESLNLAGQDPDFHRRDLWESIAGGNFPEWELGVQIVPEKDEHKFEFDLLDATKLIPEELVPVTIIGRMVLDRNPDNYFAEIEQVAFHPGHVVPGIDVSNDPLLQGRLFSYTDTQLIRLGGPNFHELPVNRPLAPVNNNQRDGHGRQHIATGRVAYEPNSLGKGCPFHSPEAMKSYVSQPERMDGHKVRARSPSFTDHFSQARMFFESQTETEKNHLRDALRFELSKVETEAVRARVLTLLNQVSPSLATAVSEKIGVAVPKDAALPPSPGSPENDIVPENHATEVARADSEENPSAIGRIKSPKSSTALSMVKTAKKSLSTRKIAVLVADGVDGAQVATIRLMLEEKGAVVQLIAPKLGPIAGGKGPLKAPKVGSKADVGTSPLKADQSFDITTALHFDAVIVPGGASAEALRGEGKALRFVAQAFKHCKAVAGFGDGARVCEDALMGFFDRNQKAPRGGWILSDDIKAGMNAFIDSASGHRVWEREPHVMNLPV